MERFDNSHYRSNWAKEIPGGGGLYRNGGYIHNASGWAIYDGANNYMGLLRPDGSIVYNGCKTDYKDTFMQSAKETLVC